MPNYCNNILKVCGNNAASFEEQFSKSGEPELNNLYSNPHQGSDEYQNWNTEHWGVKWDLVLYDEEILDDMLSYEFQTPWVAPIKWLEKVASDFPDLEFVLLYEEMGQRIAGCFSFKDGKLIQSQEVQGAEYRNYVKSNFEYDPLLGIEKE